MDLDEFSGALTSDPPVQHYAFVLTRADALAYERFPRELMGWRRLLLLAWTGLGGLTVAFLPEGWVGEEGAWRFWALILTSIAIQYGLAMVAMTAAAHHRAARRVPRPAEVAVLDHVDHLEWREHGSVFVVACETIGPVIATQVHLFIHDGSHVLIMPLRAFADRLEMFAFANALDQRSEDRQA